MVRHKDEWYFKTHLALKKLEKPFGTLTGIGFVFFAWFTVCAAMYSFQGEPFPSMFMSVIDWTHIGPHPDINVQNATGGQILIQMLKNYWIFLLWIPLSIIAYSAKIFVVFIGIKPIIDPPPNLNRAHHPPQGWRNHRIAKEQ